jgi:hypothetical protein
MQSELGRSLVGHAILKDPHMALKSPDIRPIDLIREAFALAKDSWKQVALSAGVFALLAALIAIFTSGGSKTVVQTGQMAVMFTMFLSTLTASLVTSARALGIEIPTLASSLVNDRQFWRYVWGAVACTSLVALVVLVVFLGGLSTMPEIPLPGVPLTGTFDPTPLYIAAAVGAVLSALLSVRLSLVLPAIIAGEKVSIAGSWRRTRGITTKLVATAILALGGFYVLQLIVNYGGVKALGLENASLVEGASAVVRIARNAVEGALAGVVMAKILDHEAVSQTA